MRKSYEHKYSVMQEKTNEEEPLFIRDLSFKEALLEALLLANNLTDGVKDYLKSLTPDVQNFPELIEGLLDRLDKTDGILSVEKVGFTLYVNDSKAVPVEFYSSQGEIKIYKNTLLAGSYSKLLTSSAYGANFVLIEPTEVLKSLTTLFEGVYLTPTHEFAPDNLYVNYYTRTDEKLENSGDWKLVCVKHEEGTENASYCYLHSRVYDFVENYRKVKMNGD